MKKTAFIATLVLTLAVAACKSGDTSTPSTPQSGQPAPNQPAPSAGGQPTLTPAGTGAPATVPTGGGKATTERPDDLPLYAGAKITSETKTEHLYTVTYTVNAPVDEVKQFYQKAFESGGWTSKADPIGPQPAGTTPLNMPIVMAKDTRVCSVAVGLDEKQNTTVMVRVNR